MKDDVVETISTNAYYGNDYIIKYKKLSDYFNYDHLDSGKITKTSHNSIFRYIQSLSYCKVSAALPAVIKSAAEYLDKFNPMSAKLKITFQQRSKEMKHLLELSDEASSSDNLNNILCDEIRNNECDLEDESSLSAKAKRRGAVNLKLVIAALSKLVKMGVQKQNASQIKSKLLRVTDHRRFKKWVSTNFKQATYHKFEKMKPPFKQMLLVSYPIIILHFIISSYFFINMTILARTDGLPAVGGLLNALPLDNLLCVQLVQGLSVGASTMISQLLGKNDILGTERVFSVFCLMAIIASGLIPVIFLPGLKKMLPFMGVVNEYLEFALHYNYVSFAFMPLASFLSTGMVPILRCENKVLMALFKQLLGTSLNLIFDLIFIVGARLSTYGAAIATVISQTVTGLWITSYFFQNRCVKRKRAKSTKLSEATPTTDADDNNDYYIRSADTDGISVAYISTAESTLLDKYPRRRTKHKPSFSKADIMPKRASCGISHATELTDNMQDTSSLYGTSVSLAQNYLAPYSIDHVDPVVRNYPDDLNVYALPDLLSYRIRPMVPTRISSSSLSDVISMAVSSTSSSNVNPIGRLSCERSDQHSLPSLIEVTGQPSRTPSTANMLVSPQQKPEHQSDGTVVATSPLHNTFLPASSFTPNDLKLSLDLASSTNTSAQLSMGQTKPAESGMLPPVFSMQAGDKSSLTNAIAGIVPMMIDSSSETEMGDSPPVIPAQRSSMDQSFDISKDVLKPQLSRKMSLAVPRFGERPLVLDRSLLFGTKPRERRQKTLEYLQLQARKKESEAVVNEVKASLKRKQSIRLLGPISQFSSSAGVRTYLDDNFFGPLRLTGFLSPTDEPSRTEPYGLSLDVSVDRAVISTRDNDDIFADVKALKEFGHTKMPDKDDLYIPDFIKSSGETDTSPSLTRMGTIKVTNSAQYNEFRARRIEQSHTNILFSFKHLHLSKETLSIAMRVLGLGVSAYMQTFANNLFGITGMAQHKKYNPPNLAFLLQFATASAVRTSAIFTGPIAGFTQGIVPILGYNLGANKRIRFFLSVKAALIMLFIASVIQFTLFVALADQLVLVYGFPPEYNVRAATSLRNVTYGVLFAPFLQIATMILQLQKRSLYAVLLQTTKYAGLIGFQYIYPAIFNQTFWLSMGVSVGEVVGGLFGLGVFVYQYRFYLRRAEDEAVELITKITTQTASTAAAGRVGEPLALGLLSDMAYESTWVERHMGIDLQSLTVHGTLETLRVNPAAPAPDLDESVSKITMAVDVSEMDPSMLAAVELSTLPHAGIDTTIFSSSSFLHGGRDGRDSAGGVRATRFSLDARPAESPHIFVDQIDDPYLVDISHPSTRRSIAHSSAPSTHDLKHGLGKTVSMADLAVPPPHAGLAARQSEKSLLILQPAKLYIGDVFPKGVIRRTKSLRLSK